MTSIQMPQLGETIVEGTILKWLKPEGEPSSVDEPLFELSTDKVDTEVPSPVSGTLTKILVAEGTTVAVGTALAEVDVRRGAARCTGTSLRGRRRRTSAGGAGPVAPTRPASRAVPAAVATRGSATCGRRRPAQPARRCPIRGPRSQILSPLVRKLAQEHRLDLSQVSGTGTGGRITKKDVMAAVACGGTSAPAAAAVAAASAAPALPLRPGPAVAGGGEDVVPMSHIRKAIASHMVGRSTRPRARGRWSRSTWTIRAGRASARRTRSAARDGVKLTYRRS